MACTPLLAFQPVGQTWQSATATKLLCQNEELTLMVTKLTNNKQPYYKGYSLILIADSETKSSTLSKNSNQVIKDEQGTSWLSSVA